MHPPWTPRIDPGRRHSCASQDFNHLQEMSSQRPGVKRQPRREVDCTAVIIVGTSTAVSLAVPRCSAEPVVFAARRKSFEMTARNFLPRARLRDDTTGAAAGIIMVNIPAGAAALASGTGPPEIWERARRTTRALTSKRATED